MNDDELLLQAIEKRVGKGAAPVATKKLMDYWSKGEGAAKIGWGTPGDYGRCQRQLKKYVPNAIVDGLCANLHKKATGDWPGKRDMTSIEDAERINRETQISDHLAATRSRVQVYHWKAGWVALDHPSIDLNRRKFDFLVVAPEHLPRADHVEVRFNEATRSFLVQDHRSGHTLEITEAEAERVRLRWIAGANEFQLVVQDEAPAEPAPPAPPAPPPAKRKPITLDEAEKLVNGDVTDE